MKRLILLVVELSLVVSCENIQVSNNIDKTPYISVNKLSIDHYIDISVEEYVLKIRRKENMIVMLYSSDCVYCKKLINHIINPYIINTSNVVYGLDVYDNENYVNLYKIKEYQPIGNDYYFEDRIIRPVIQIFDQGKIIAYQKGYSIKSKKILENYILN